MFGIWPGITKHLSSQPLASTVSRISKLKPDWLIPPAYHVVRPFSLGQSKLSVQGENANTPAKQAEESTFDRTGFGDPEHPTEKVLYTFEEPLRIESLAAPIDSIFAEQGNIVPPIKPRAQYYAHDLLKPYEQRYLQRKALDEAQRRKVGIGPISKLVKDYLPYLPHPELLLNQSLFTSITNFILDVTPAPYSPHERYVENITRPKNLRAHIWDQKQLNGDKPFTWLQTLKLTALPIIYTATYLQHQLVRFIDRPVNHFFYKFLVSGQRDWVNMNYKILIRLGDNIIFTYAEIATFFHSLNILQNIKRYLPRTFYMLRYNSRQIKRERFIRTVLPLLRLTGDIYGKTDHRPLHSYDVMFDIDRIARLLSIKWKAFYHHMNSIEIIDKPTIFHIPKVKGKLDPFILDGRNTHLEAQKYGMPFPEVLDVASEAFHADFMTRILPVFLERRLKDKLLSSVLTSDDWRLRRYRRTVQNYINALSSVKKAYKDEKITGKFTSDTGFFYKGKLFPPGKYVREPFKKPKIEKRSHWSLPSILPKRKLKYKPYIRLEAYRDYFNTIMPAAPDYFDASFGYVMDPFGSHLAHPRLRQMYRNQHGYQSNDYWPQYESLTSLRLYFDPPPGFEYEREPGLASYDTISELKTVRWRSAFDDPASNAHRRYRSMIADRSENVADGPLGNQKLANILLVDLGEERMNAFKDSVASSDMYLTALAELDETLTPAERDMILASISSIHDIQLRRALQIRLSEYFLYSSDKINPYSLERLDRETIMYYNITDTIAAYWVYLGWLKDSYMEHLQRTTKGWNDFHILVEIISDAVKTIPNALRFIPIEPSPVTYFLTWMYYRVRPIPRKLTYIFHAVPFPLSLIARPLTFTIKRLIDTVIDSFIAPIRCILYPPGYLRAQRRMPILVEDSFLKTLLKGKWVSKPKAARKGKYDYEGARKRLEERSKPKKTPQVKVLQPTLRQEFAAYAHYAIKHYPLLPYNRRQLEAALPYILGRPFQLVSEYINFFPVAMRYGETFAFHFLGRTMDYMTGAVRMATHIPSAIISTMGIDLSALSEMCDDLFTMVAPVIPYELTTDKPAKFVQMMSLTVQLIHEVYFLLAECAIETYVDRVEREYGVFYAPDTQFTPDSTSDDAIDMSFATNILCNFYRLEGESDDDVYNRLWSIMFTNWLDSLQFVPGHFSQESILANYELNVLAPVKRYYQSQCAGLSQPESDNANHLALTFYTLGDNIRLLLQHDPDFREKIEAMIANDNDKVRARMEEIALLDEYRDALRRAVHYQVKIKQTGSLMQRLSTTWPFTHNYLTLSITSISDLPAFLSSVYRLIYDNILPLIEILSPFVNSIEDITDERVLKEISGIAQTLSDPLLWEQCDDAVSIESTQAKLNAHTETLITIMHTMGVRDFNHGKRRYDNLKDSPQLQFGPSSTAPNESDSTTHTYDMQSSTPQQPTSGSVLRAAIQQIQTQRAQSSVRLDVSNITDDLADSDPDGGVIDDRVRSFLSESAIAPQPSHPFSEAVEFSSANQNPIALLMQSLTFNDSEADRTANFFNQTILDEVAQESWDLQVAGTSTQTQTMPFQLNQ